MTTNTAFYLPAINFSDVFSAKTVTRQIKTWLDMQRLKSQIEKERRELAEMPEHLLKDIGVDRFDALAEARRGFHDVPMNRRRCQIC